MALVSVIIPVYNVKDYLVRCVKSVLHQSISDIEIILVDDGSTDGSEGLCDELQATDNRIRVIHQVNQGLGPARNSGLNIATGKYVSFIDSDDWIEHDTYKEMLDSMERNDCLIATCGRKIVDDENCLELVYCSDSEKLLKGSEIIEHYLLQTDMNMSACDKLFERSLFSDVRFPSGFVSEDIVPIYEVLKGVDRIVLTGKSFYNYYCRPGSLSHTTQFTKKRMGQLLYSIQVAEDVKKLYPKLREQADYYVFDALISTWRTILRANYMGEERKQVRNQINKAYKNMVVNKYMHTKQRFYTVFMLLRIDWIVEKFI